MNNAVAHLHSLISLSQMSSPVGKYLYYQIFYVDWKEFSFSADYRQGLFYNNSKWKICRQIVTYDIALWHIPHCH